MALPELTKAKTHNPKLNTNIDFNDFSYKNLYRVNRLLMNHFYSGGRLLPAGKPYSDFLTKVMREHQEVYEAVRKSRNTLLRQCDQLERKSVNPADKRLVKDWQVSMMARLNILRNDNRVKGYTTICDYKWPNVVNKSNEAPFYSIAK